MKFKSAIDIHKNKLIISPISGSDLFCVEEDFYYYINYINKDGKIFIPKGFITDFGSIPPPFSMFLKPTKYISFVIHDTLWKKYFEGIEFKDIENIPKNYRGNLSIKDDKIIFIPDRLTCDLILDEALKVEGASFLYRLGIRVGLFIGGPFTFNR